MIRQNTQRLKENESKFCMILVICIAISVGIISVTQAGINIHLSIWTQHPLRSAFISFFVGTICLLPLFLFYKPKETPQDITSIEQQTDNKILTNLMNELKQNKRNYFVFCNGSCGVLWVCSAIFIAPQIGFSLYAICTTLGQIIASSSIDHFGLIWSKIKPLSLLNLCGICIAISGVIIFQIPRFIIQNKTNVNILFFVYIIVSILAGISVTIQSALNRRLKVIMKSTPYQSSFLSFLNGAIVLFIMNIILYIMNGDWFEVRNEYLNWYIFFGGMFGSIIVSLYIICPEYIGFVATYICAIFGSLMISLIYDAVGAFGISLDEQNTIHLLQIIGVICVFIGTIMVNIKRQQNIDTQPNHIDDVQVDTELQSIDEQHR